MEQSTCRYCDFELDGDDIFASLSKHHMYAHLTHQQLEDIARKYGWTPSNNKRFRHDVIIQFNKAGKQQITICPKCNGIFPRNTAYPREHYHPPHNPHKNIDGCGTGSNM